MTPALSVVPPTQPRVLAMAKPIFPATCGKFACVHPGCETLRAHWKNRTCVDCHQIIVIGELYTATGVDLRHHGQCPERTP